MEDLVSNFVTSELWNGGRQWTLDDDEVLSPGGLLMRELARIGDGAEACLYKASLRLDKQLGSWIVVDEDSKVVDESRGAVVSHD